MNLEQIKQAYLEAMERETGYRLQEGAIQFETATLVQKITIHDAVDFSLPVGDPMGPINLINKGDGWWLSF